MEEGTLPIRQAKTDEQVAEERRLLYVGITRARTHLAISWSRKPSQFLAEIRPQTVRIIPSVGGPAPRRGLNKRRIARGSSTLASRTREARRHARLRHRPRLDPLRDRGAPKPSTLAALRRVKGMGPVKVDQYGAEILAVIANSTS